MEERLKCPQKTTQLLWWRRGESNPLRKGVHVPLQGWQDISYFEDFIAGALPGVPLEQASHSLVEAAAQIFNEFDLSSVRRDWLSIVAVRQ